MSELAAALGRIPSGIFVVTCHRDTTELAFLASWVQQCSFEPPMLSVAIQRDREIGRWLREGTSFSLHILAEGQRDLLSHFGKGRRLDELPGHPDRVQRKNGQAPVILDALAVLHCTPVHSCDSGDHRLIVARIDDGSLNRDDKPMIHVRKSGMTY